MLWPEASSHKTSGIYAPARPCNYSPEGKKPLSTYSLSSPLFFRPHPRYSADKHVKLLVVSLLDIPHLLMPKSSTSTASLLG